MKILACATPGNTIGGFQKAAEVAGHKWVWWEERAVPAFDAFYDIKPDVVMFTGKSNLGENESCVSRAFGKCIDSFGGIVIQGIETMPFVFTATKARKQELHTFKALVDIHTFRYDCCVDEALACDVGIVAAPCERGLKLCNSMTPLNIKIMHEIPWPVSQYIGVPSLAQKNKLYNSANTVIVDSVVEAIRVMYCGEANLECVGEETQKFFADKIKVEHPMTKDCSFPEGCLKDASYDEALKKMLESVK